MTALVGFTSLVLPGTDSLWNCICRVRVTFLRHYHRVGNFMPFRYAALKWQFNIELRGLFKVELSAVVAHLGLKLWSFRVSKISVHVVHKTQSQLVWLFLFDLLRVNWVVLLVNKLRLHHLKFSRHILCRSG